MSKQNNKLTVMALVMMIFTSVYGFTNGPRGFLLMGYASIIWYIVAALGFFVPYAFMMAEYGSAFKNEKGGIYSWMERSVGPRYAFTGFIMWYASYLIWMVNVSNGIWVPFTTMLTGRDATMQMGFAGLSYGHVLGLLAFLWIGLITLISSRGINSIAFISRIGGLAVWGLNIVLILGAVIILAIKGSIVFNLDGLQSAALFFQSPNPSYQNPVMILSFFVFAIFAFGGLEAVAGLVDKTENPEKSFPKAIIVSSLVIAVGYSVCILAIGVFADWNTITNNNDGSATLANVGYIIMNELGVKLAEAFNASPEAATAWGMFFARYTGLSMFFALTGAFFTLYYAPLKQLIGGTPSAMWPAFMLKEKNGVPVNAFMVQSSIVAIFILLNSFGGEGAEEFFLILQSATNVAMTIPYMFLSIAFFFFKKNEQIHKPFVIYKSKVSTLIAVITVTAIVGLANFYAIFGPVLSDGMAGLKNTLYYLGGPLFFIAIALIIFSRYEKKQKNL